MRNAKLKHNTEVNVEKRSAAQDNAHELQERVTKMYMHMPIPNYADEEILKSIKAVKMNYYRTLGLDPLTFFKGKKVLDGGCGTGEESIVMASLGAEEVVGIDLSDASLKRANEKKQYCSIDNVHFHKQSVLDIQYPDNTFDVVLSAGVIHHTPDPYGAFQELVRVLKPGGVLMLFVYNDYAHYFHNIEKKIVEILGGEDIHKRYLWAKRLYPWRLKRYKMQSAHRYFDMDALLYDQYAVPKKSEHGICEVLHWFKENDISYVSTVPPVEIPELVRYVKRRGIENSAGVNASPWKRFLCAIANRIATSSEKDSSPTPKKTPSLASRAVTNALYFMRGLRDYSSGPRYCGVKRV